MRLSDARAGGVAEEGFALIEGVVSAAVLVIVVLGVLSALDAVSGTAGANRARTVAATLAEEDQERMRGMQTVSISGYQETRTVAAAGVSYTISSKAEWIRDATGETVSCTSEEGQVNYLRITSTVTSPATGAAVKPVVISSLVAPPAGSLGTKGTLAVSVKNAAGLPVMNLPVRLSGTAARDGTTNEEGCVVFSLIPAGTYVVTLNQGGWVDRAGVQASARSGVTVTAGNVATVSMEYDRAAGLTVEVETLPYGATAPVPDPSSSLVAANTGIPPSGFLVAAPAAPTSTINLGGLFPFTDEYTIYSGDCQGNDPSLPEHTPNYFESFDGQVQLAPGVPGATITVREPAINVRVTRGGNRATAPTNNNADGYARLYSLGEGCGGSFRHTLDDAGAMVNPGVPFGAYDVCVGDGHRRQAWARNVVNGDPDGTGRIDLWLDTSAGASRPGDCPGEP